MPRTTLMRRGALAALLLAAALRPLPLGAEGLQSLLERSGYTASAREEIRILFARAGKEGVPEALLLPRLAEGLAKKISAPRLQAALRQHLAQLRQARALLEQVPGGERIAGDEASWARTANLIAAGVQPGDLARLVQAGAARPEAYRPATYVYASLIAWGLQVDEALALVEALLSSPLPADQFAAVPELLAQGRRLRVAPEELVRRLLEELPHADGIERLRERVMR